MNQYTKSKTLNFYIALVDAAAVFVSLSLRNNIKKALQSQSSRQKPFRAKAEFSAESEKICAL